MNDQPFQCWAVLELFGHKRIAGEISEATIGGCSFIRVDCPAAVETVATGYTTHYYGQGAIYAFHPVSEDVARAAAATCKVDPVSVYDFSPEVRAKISQGMLFDTSVAFGTTDADSPDPLDEPEDPDIGEGFSP